MNPEALEVAVREVSYYAVLLAGAFFVAGSCAALAGWALKKSLEAIGVYAEFVGFVRSRRRKR